MEGKLKLRECDEEDLAVLAYYREELIEAIKEDIPELQANVTDLKEKISNRYYVHKKWNKVMDFLFSPWLSIFGFVVGSVIIFLFSLLSQKLIQW